MSVIKGEGTTPIIFASTSIPAGALTHTGYLARPDLSGEHPTVLVIPGAWGLTSSAKDICRRLARHGFSAIAPDLYRDRPPDRDAAAATAVAAAYELDLRRSLAVVDDYIDFITNPAGYWSSAEYGFAVLAIGTGGRVASRVAAHPLVRGLALLASPLADRTEIDEDGDERVTELGVAASLANVTAPILGLYAKGDGDEAIETARDIAPHAQWALYDGVAGDFYDDYREGFDYPSFIDAMNRLIEFFEKTVAS